MHKVFHGGALDDAITKYGGGRADWLDLSTGINPNAYPVGSLPDAIWQQLPDAKAEQKLLDAARTYYKVPQNKTLIAAPGTQAIIELLPYVVDAKNASILSPTYGEHFYSWEKAGATVSTIQNISDLKSTDVLVIVNPNNPTAHMFEPDELCKLASKVKYLIVDEAFCDCCSQKSLVPTMPDNVIVLKSFGKFFGLAGLRLGFAVCNEIIAKKIALRLGPWAVSGPALMIGAEAFADQAWISEMRNSLQQNSQKLANTLSVNGFEIAGINPLFVYVKHEESERMYVHLCEQHILVRKFPERQGYLRVGLCKDDADLKWLENALKSYG